MHSTSEYDSPLGKILLACDDVGLTGVWFERQKYFAFNLDKEHQPQDNQIFTTTKKWLDIYFSGQEPDFLPPLHLVGTKFRTEVWKILLRIPYGQTMTYGQIAKLMATKHGLKTMSAQAVGGAVGHNDISIIIPCHRVVGTNSSLTGYAGGIDRKVKLFQLEHMDLNKFIVPTKGTAI